MMLKVLQSRYFKIVSGLTLGGTSIYDISKDVTAIHKEHMTLILAGILIFHSATEFVEDSRKVIRTVKKQDSWVFSRGLQKFLHSVAYTFSVGIIIIVASVYDIIGDITEMRKEHFEMVIGFIFIFMAIKKIQEERLKMKECLVRREGSIRGQLSKVNDELSVVSSE